MIVPVSSRTTVSRASESQNRAPGSPMRPIAPDRGRRGRSPLEKITNFRLDEPALSARTALSGIWANLMIGRNFSGSQKGWLSAQMQEQRHGRQATADEKAQHYLTSRQHGVYPLLDWTLPRLTQTLPGAFGQDFCRRHRAAERLALGLRHGVRARFESTVRHRTSLCVPRRHPNCVPPPSNAAVMCVTAILTETEQKRQDRSVHRAEERLPMTRMMRFCGLPCQHSSVLAHASAA